MKIIILSLIIVMDSRLSSTEQSEASLMADVEKYVTIHSDCLRESNSCGLDEFLQKYSLKPTNLLQAFSLFIIVKPIAIDKKKNYLKEWQHQSRFHRNFFQRIGITMCTIDCDMIRTQSTLCRKDDHKTFKYILIGKYFGTKIYQNHFDIFYSINYPLEFLMKSLEKQINRFDDWTSISERKIAIKDYIIVINIIKGKVFDFFGLLELFKLEQYSNSRFVANISLSHESRRMTLLSGSCVQDESKSPEMCIVRAKDFYLTDPFICIAYLSTLNVDLSSNIVDLSNKHGINSKTLQQLIKGCDSIFMAVNVLKDSTNIVQLFTKLSQIKSDNKTLLIFLSKKQMKTIASFKHYLVHFKSDVEMLFEAGQHEYLQNFHNPKIYRDFNNSPYCHYCRRKEIFKNPRVFESSISDENALAKFLQFQFETLVNPVILQSSDLDMYNEKTSDDLIRTWSQSAPSADQQFHFIPPIDIRSDQNTDDFITKNLNHQNFTILVLIQKWITEFDILSLLLHQANFMLNREIGIENVYQGVDCWKFDQFCLKLGVHSEYPLFIVFKNQNFIKSFRNGEYSGERFRKIALMYYQPAVSYDYQLGGFKHSLTKLLGISDFLIIVAQKNENPNVDLMLKIGEKYHGFVPVLSTKLSFLPTKIQNHISDAMEPIVTAAYQASDGWRYLNPKRLVDLCDVEMIESLIHLYSVNQMTLDELSRFKSEKRQILIHVALIVDVKRLRRLKEDLYDTIILKYVDMVKNKEIGQYLHMTSAPALVYVDFSTNNIFMKYEGIWGSVHILEWLSNILQGKILPHFNFNTSPKYIPVKPRIYYENKIRFGPEEADQSQYYVTSHETYNYDATDGFRDLQGNYKHDEL